MRQTCERAGYRRLNFAGRQPPVFRKAVPSVFAFPLHLDCIVPIQKDIRLSGRTGVLYRTDSTGRPSASRLPCGKRASGLHGGRNKFHATFLWYRPSASLLFSHFLFFLSPLPYGKLVAEASGADGKTGCGRLGLADRPPQVCHAANLRAGRVPAVELCRPPISCFP